MIRFYVRFRVDSKQSGVKREKRVDKSDGGPAGLFNLCNKMSLVDSNLIIRPTSCLMLSC